MENKSGIYKIINKETGDFYIGSSKHVNKRFKEHKTLLRNNKHKNTHLQYSWNKHGENAFDFMFLQEVEICDLTTMEQGFLDILQPVYNKSPVAGGGCSSGWETYARSHRKNQGVWEKS